MLKSYKTKLEKEGSVYLLCKVFPDSKETKIKEIIKNNVEGKKIEVITFLVSSPATKNRANKDMIKFLSKEFGLPENNISIISGSTNRTKLIKIKK